MAFTTNWQRLRAVLEDARGKLTRVEVREQWPADRERPSETSLWRWLEQAVQLGLVRQEGTGRRHAL